MFKSTENLGTDLTVEDSIYNWGAGSGGMWNQAASRQVLSVNAKWVGCAIGDCSNPVRIVSPTFIRRSDFRTLYRPAG